MSNVRVGSVPADPISAQLRVHLNEGCSPEQARDLVLRPYGNAPLAVTASSLILSIAREEHRRRNRRVENQAFASGRLPDRLRVATFRVDGVEVSWEDATAVQHEARAVWADTMADGYRLDADRHRRAAKLLRDRGVERLANVAGWEELLRDAPEAGGSASAEVLGDGDLRDCAEIELV